MSEGSEAAPKTGLAIWAVSGTVALVMLIGGAVAFTSGSDRAEQGNPAANQTLTPAASATGPARSPSEGQSPGAPGDVETPATDPTVDPGTAGNGPGPLSDDPTDPSWNDPGTAGSGRPPGQSGTEPIEEPMAGRDPGSVIAAEDTTGGSTGTTTPGSGETGTEGSSGGTPTEPGTGETDGSTRPGGGATLEPTIPEDPAPTFEPAPPGSGGGTSPSDPGTTDPGTTDPGTGGGTSPADPGTTDPGTGGGTSPADPGTTDPGTGGGTSPVDPGPVAPDPGVVPNPPAPEPPGPVTPPTTTPPTTTPPTTAPPTTTPPQPEPSPTTPPADPTAVQFTDLTAAWSADRGQLTVAATAPRAAGTYDLQVWVDEKHVSARVEVGQDGAVTISGPGFAAAGTRIEARLTPADFGLTDPTFPVGSSVVVSASLDGVPTMVAPLVWATEPTGPTVPPAPENTAPTTPEASPAPTSTPVAPEQGTVSDWVPDPAPEQPAVTPQQPNAVLSTRRIRSTSRRVR